MKLVDAPRLVDAPDVLTVDQVAELLQVDRKSVYRAVKLGELGSVRLGRTIRVSKESLRTYLRVNDGADWSQEGEK